jgi:hypothetical protein
MRDKSEDVGHLRAGQKLHFEKGPFSDTAQWTASGAAFAGALVEAEKAQIPTPNVQATSQADSDESPIPDGQARAGAGSGFRSGATAGAVASTTRGPTIGPQTRAELAACVPATRCASAGAFVVALIGATAGADFGPLADAFTGAAVDDKRSGFSPAMVSVGFSRGRSRSGARAGGRRAGRGCRR